MADAHANFAYSTVATAPSPASSGTSLVVASGNGALFPAAPFNATVWPAGAMPLATNAEIVRVTAKSTDTFTIARSQEGSGARSIGVGDQIAASITAKTLTDAEGPGAEVDYQQITASVTVTGSEASPTDVLTFNAFTADGATKYRVEFCFQGATSATSGDRLVLSLWEGSTDLGRLQGAFIQTPAAATLIASLVGAYEFTPASGSHTYKIRAWRVTANATVVGGAGGVGTNLPGWARIVKVS